MSLLDNDLNVAQVHIFKYCSSGLSLTTIFTGLQQDLNRKFIHPHPILRFETHTPCFVITASTQWRPSKMSLCDDSFSQMETLFWNPIKINTVIVLIVVFIIIIFIIISSSSSLLLHHIHHIIIINIVITIIIMIIIINYYHNHWFLRHRHCNYHYCSYHYHFIFIFTIIIIVIIECHHGHAIN